MAQEFRRPSPDFSKFVPQPKIETPLPDTLYPEIPQVQEIVVVDDFIRIEHFNPKNRHETQYIAINRRYIVSVHKTKQTFDIVEHDVYVTTVVFGNAISSFHSFDNPLKDLDL